MRRAFLLSAACIMGAFLGSCHGSSIIGMGDAARTPVTRDLTAAKMLAMPGLHWMPAPAGTDGGIAPAGALLFRVGVGFDSCVLHDPSLKPDGWTFRDVGDACEEFLSAEWLRPS